MTVFLSHVPADHEAAEALETFLERRGHFVERDDGEQALRPVQQNDVVILLHSKDFVFAPMRLRLEQRALDAWAEGKLILVKLDNNFAPVGLRDLPFVNASFEAQREFKWQEISNAIREALKPKPPAPLKKGAERPSWSDELNRVEKRERSETEGDARETAAKWRRGGLLRLLLGIVVMLPGLFALVASGAIWLVNRIAPTPGTFADLVRGIDGFGVKYGLPSGVAPPLFAFFIALTVLTPIALFVLGRMDRARLRKYEGEHPELTEDYEGPSIADAGPPVEAMFVSYARANSEAVMPVVDGAREGGRKFWIDKEGIVSGDSWAGEIVRAIKGAAGVVVMCSKAAFESDHVKREIYLADRYHKKLVPVFIEQAEPPEDFEYFFAGVQALNLFETPQEERSAALLKAISPA